MSEQDRPSQSNEYEPPSLATLGSTEDLTGGQDQDTVETIVKTAPISDAFLKTEIGPVTGAVERLRRLGVR